MSRPLEQSRFYVGLHRGQYRGKLVRFKHALPRTVLEPLLAWWTRCRDLNIRNSETDELAIRIPLRLSRRRSVDELKLRVIYERQIGRAHV